MRKNFYLAVIGLMSLLQTTAQTNQALPAQKSLPDGVSEDWYSKATSILQQREYSFKALTDNFQFGAANGKNRVGFFVNKAGYTVKNIQYQFEQENWSVDFNIIGVGKKKQSLQPVAAPLVYKTEHSLNYAHPGFDIEYINNETGLRQNFIVKEKPAGEGELKVVMQLSGDLVPRISKEGTLTFYDPKTKKTKLIYDGLKVWDAAHKVLPAHMELDNDRLSIVINDKDAVYPVTIDPLNHTPEWTTSANAVLPGLLINLGLQVDALYGYNVAGVGDVNGDGFDDVAIGAPGAIDVIAGPITIVSAGAVFVYFGSPAGPSTTPDKVLRATTPVANALFGFSIAGGNVNGDSRNDIVVGAPGESYTASVSGFPATATVTAGKVYVFRGEDLSAVGNPSPFLSVFLNGSGFFSNGILGIGSNVTINALFGFSVGVTEDLGSDGLGEVIVGSPGYAALQLLPVRSGAAFVYNSTNLLAAPVQLTTPAAGLLGIPLLSNGLLFGFSVDGVGDYNQDGKPDVVVGAPGGILLGPGSVLEGTAYVYNGTGISVNPAIGTQLTASGGLLNTIANLFGYSVRGVRDANGSRNGNILVGSPAGNVLSNILLGLRLKTGTINVFVKTVAPVSPKAPAQSFSSPRGPSILAILAGQNLDASMLFGASIDNMLDVNCDGINDIIVGEPLSTGVGIISANALGGAAYIFLGNANGTFNTTPYWTLENTVSFAFGINAGSLLGYSVAGARHVRGPLQGVRALVGAPGAMLDFSSGIFNLGGTFGTLFSAIIGAPTDNGLGKAYMFGFVDCGIIFNPDVNVTWVNVPVPGNVNTNDKVPPGTTYGTPIPDGGNPGGGTINMNPDGTYTFTSTTPGVFYYQVPVCIPGQVSPCPTVELKITVLAAGSNTNPPVANTDVAVTKAGNSVILFTLSNDQCSNIGCSLNPASVMVTVSPSNGTTSVDPVTGNITYSPNAGFTGKDTLTYQVCDNASPAKCATAQQIITVNATTALNTTDAADDYVYTEEGVSVNDNVKLNDTDPEGNTQIVTAQTTTITGKGTLTLNTDGTFTFVPVSGFSGPVEFPYTTCDNGTPSVCASATLHILVTPLSALPVTLVEFKARQNQQNVTVSWITSQEINLSRFEVMRSLDGLNYVTIGTVSATGGPLGTNYQFIDIAPVKGNNYYRLKSIDNDASFKYSAIAVVKLADKNNFLITVSPNPVVNQYNVRLAGLEKGAYRIELFNSNGQLQMKKKIIITEFDHVENMQRNSSSGGGLYWLNIVNEKTNSTVKTMRIFMLQE